MMGEKQIESALNHLIEVASANGGHVYVVDKRKNAFALKLTEPVTIHFYGGFQNNE